MSDKSSKFKPRSIQATDAALEIYYKLKDRDDYVNKDGKGKFLVLCDENGFVDEDLVDEMEATADDCMLLDFDDHFPGVQSGDLEGIFHVVKQCYKDGPKAQFEQKQKRTQEMKYAADMYDISHKDKEEITKVYMKQCPKSFLGAMLKDESTFKVMMIGHKVQKPYIQYLVDDYLRCRIEHHLQYKTPLTIKKWRGNHKHFKMLKDISESTADLVEGAVKGFSTRICPVLLFQPIAKIKGSLEETANAIFAAIQFISGLSTTKGNCPFQMDFCIGFDPMTSTVDEDDNNSDDESDDDDSMTGGTKGYEVDRIGKIIEKLHANNGNGVIYHENDMDAYGGGLIRVIRGIRDCYNGYMKKSKQQSPQHKRFIAFVDKRTKKDKEKKNEQKKDKKKDEKKDEEKDEEKEIPDRMIIYSAPNGCSDIPQNAVSEWYLSSSSMCLIPNKEYKVQKMMVDDQKDNNYKGNKKKVISTADKLETSNIGSKDPASMITLSFHVKQDDCIACYLYAMGQYTRFMPNDIMDILSGLFEESIENTSFTQDKDIKESIQYMKKLLIDNPFQEFRKNQCNHPNVIKQPVTN